MAESVAGWRWVDKAEEFTHDLCVKLRLDGVSQRALAVDNAPRSIFAKIFGSLLANQ